MYRRADARYAALIETDYNNNNNDDIDDTDVDATIEQVNDDDDDDADGPNGMLRVRSHARGGDSGNDQPIDEFDIDAEMFRADDGLNLSFSQQLNVSVENNENGDRDETYEREPPNAIAKSNSVTPSQAPSTSSSSLVPNILKELRSVSELRKLTR